MPAPTIATFASVFGDASLDPTGGNEAALLQPFLHDLNNLSNNTGTKAIKNKLAQSGSQHRLIAATILSGGHARLYICPFCWEDDLITQNPSLNNKFFAFEGKLIGNQGHTIVVEDEVFCLTTNSQLVPTISTITTAIASDSTIKMMGPYTTVDANTMSIKTRKIIPVPHFLAGLWLTHEEGITPRQFWEVVYPVIVGAGKERECAALLHYFQNAITRTGGAAGISAIDTTQPSPTARNQALINCQLDILKHHFPQLRTDAPIHQTNLIAQGLGVIAHQQQMQFEEAKREREEAKASTVAKMFGEENFEQLLRMLQLPNEAQVIAACPVYKAMAASSKAQRMGTLQSAINKELMHQKKLSSWCF